MNEMIDPLLQASNETWPAPQPETAASSTPRPRTKKPTTSVADRRQMLQDLKARQVADVAVAEQPVPETARVSKTAKKKAPRPARAAKIFVFGLSTTAMFGAVSGYALADLQQKQQPVPGNPVIVPTEVATTATPSPAVGEVASQATANSTPTQKTPRPSKNITDAAPVDNPPVAQTPTQSAPADTNVVVDVPVPQSAQAGQGQTSGGTQQSSGSH